MSPAEAAAATVTVICVAVIAAYRTLCWLLDRHLRARRAERAELAQWQARAAEVAADVETARRQREIAQLEAWLQLSPHRKIPHQTRRTEEDQ
jgi:recombinational DNA repair ATPase RecF